jgi:hypothetical protein
MSEGEFLQVVESAKARTTTVVHRGRDWRVTPFHCVVGPIEAVHFGKIALYWSSLYGDNSAPTKGVGSVKVVHRGVYDYVSDWARDEVGRLREQYAGARLLFYAQDPLVVNEMLPGEVSLAVVEDDEVVLTNFVDLFDPVGRLKVYALGEWWLSYAVGGVEPLLRFGGARPVRVTRVAQATRPEDEE